MSEDTEVKLLNYIKATIGQKNVPTSDILRRITEKIGIYGVADIISPIKQDILDPLTDLQKYDLVRIKLGNLIPHYAVVEHVDVTFSTLWVVVITSDTAIGLSTEVIGSRLFPKGSQYCCSLTPISIPVKGKIEFCGTIDNKAEFNKVSKAIKLYYRDMFKQI